MLFGGDRAGSDDVLEADLETTTRMDDLELEEDAEVLDCGGEEIVFLD